MITSVHTLGSCIGFGKRLSGFGDSLRSPFSQNTGPYHAVIADVSPMPRFSETSDLLSVSSYVEYILVCITVTYLFFFVELTTLLGICSGYPVQSRRWARGKHARWLLSVARLSAGLGARCFSLSRR